MSKRHSHHIALVFSEAVLLLISGGVLFILISRVAGPDLLGRYSLVLGWLLFFQGVGGFGIPEFIMRELGAHGEQGGRYLSHGMVLATGTSIVATAAMVLLAVTLNYPDDVKQALLCACIALVPMTLSQVCRAGFLALERMKWVALVAILEAVVMVTASTYLLLTGHGVVPLVTTLVGAKTLSSIVALYLFNKHALKILMKFEWPFARTLIRAIFAFGISNSLGMVAVRANTLMLSFWGSMAAVGYYAAASKVMEIALILPNLCAQILMPRIARKYAKARNHELGRFDSQFHVIFAVTMSAGVGGFLFADTIVRVLFGSQFEEAVWVLRILMVFFLIETVDALMGVILKTAGRQNTDARIFALNPGVNVALNLVLIPLAGGPGAAIAKVAGVIASSLVRYIVISRQITKLDWFKKLFAPLAGSIALGSALLIFERWVDDLLLAVCYTLLCAAFIVPRVRRSLGERTEQ